MKKWILLCFSLVLSTQSCKQGNSTKEISKVVESKGQEVTVAKEEGVDFPIYNYEGIKPLLHKQDDKTYIVNFWATWCKPCIAELPDFEKTYAEQKDNNVEMILVSLDMPSMWKTRLVPFVKKKDLKGKVVILDDKKMNDWIPKIAEDWEGGIPATLIYNKNKRTFYPHGFTYDELNTELAKFLN